jgi:2-phospho-L-lactate guanylyltransferase
MSICVVVPMKSPARAKQRLSAVLPAHQRQALALSLFTHTLAFFNAQFPKLDVLVVSEEHTILTLANDYGCLTLAQQAGGDLNDALTEAADWVARAGYDGLFIIPSDIAVLSPLEIQTLLDHAQMHRVVLALAKDGGTNALLACPPCAIEFQFGANSALAHQRECARKGVQVTPLTLTNLALDIDQQSDLALAQREGAQALEGWQYA